MEDEQLSDHSLGAILKQLQKSLRSILQESEEWQKSHEQGAKRLDSIVNMAETLQVCIKEPLCMMLLVKCEAFALLDFDLKGSMQWHREFPGLIIFFDVMNVKLEQANTISNAHLHNIYVCVDGKGPFFTFLYVTIDVMLNFDIDANVTCEQALERFWVIYTANIYTVDYF